MSECYKNEGFYVWMSFPKGFLIRFWHLIQEPSFKRTGSYKTEAALAPTMFPVPLDGSYNTVSLTAAAPQAVHLRQCSSSQASILGMSPPDHVSSTTSSAVNWNARYKCYWKGLAASISSKEC